MTEIGPLLDQWTNATAELEWGTQRAFHDVLTLASEEKTTLVYNADYYAKGACLVNQAGNIITTGGGYGVPMANFGEVVSLFDRVNRALKSEGVNTNENYVSPLAAEILVRHFAPLRDVPTPTTEETIANLPYREPSDEEMQSELLKMFAAEAIVESDTEEPANAFGDPH